MATVQSAMDKYSRKTGPGSPAVANYNAAKARMGTNYRGGMSRFLGAPLSPSVAAAYDAGIQAAQYSGGDPNKWRTNFMAKMTGG